MIQLGSGYEKVCEYLQKHNINSLEEIVGMDAFHIFLAVMTGIAVIVFVALYFVKAGYGMFFDAKWGRPIDNRIGWVLMEAPVFIAMALFWYFG